MSEFIPPKGEPQVPQSIIPKDLQEQWDACKTVSTAFNVMQNGSYAHMYMKALDFSLCWLKGLHEEFVDKALKHPQAHMISELREIKQTQAKAAEAVETEIAGVQDGAI